MNTKTLSLVIGIAAIAVAGCHLNAANSDPTACAGYIGCSGHTDKAIGVAPQAQSTTDGSTTMREPINQGCLVGFPAGQMNSVADKPTGYTHYTVQAKGETLTQTIASKAGPRTFWVRLPVNYMSDHKYRTVYIGQGCGGYNVANTATYPLFSAKQGGTDDAIYVALDIPTDMANQDCYDNRDGPASQEWEAFELIHTMVDKTFCVDNDRVYISGYSTGGWLTNMWGCYFAGDGEHPWNGKPQAISQSSSLSSSELTSRANNVSDGGTSDGKVADGAAGSAGTTGAAGTTGGAGTTGSAGDTGSAGTTGDAGSDASSEGSGGPTVDAGTYTPPAGARRFAPQYHIRAQAATSGGEPDNNPLCNGPVAAFWLHDINDSNAYPANHTFALNRVLKMNGCYSTTPKTMPWHETELGKGVCVQYVDCPAAYPVVFCTTSGQGHGAQPEKAIPGYTIFFNELEDHFSKPVQKP